MNGHECQLINGILVTLGTMLFVLIMRAGFKHISGNQHRRETAITDLYVGLTQRLMNRLDLQEEAVEVPTLDKLENKVLDELENKVLDELEKPTPKEAK